MVQLMSHMQIKESLYAQDYDKIKVKRDVGQPVVHMMKVNKSNPKPKYDSNNKPNKKPSGMVCWRCQRTGHTKQDCKANLNRNGTRNNGGENSGGGNSRTKDSAAPKGGHNFFYLNSSIHNYCSLILESF